MKRKAFTLAEVLITLLLIGVVAAFTIPVFISEFSKNKWTLAFKRSFAETYNALGRIALDEDCAKSLTCTNIFRGGQDASTMELGKKLASTMSTARICGKGEKEGAVTDQCFSHEISIGLSGGKKQTLYQTMTESESGQIGFNDSNPFYTYITTRGVSYAVFSFGLNCLNAVTDENRELVNTYIDWYVHEADKPDNQMLSLCGFIVVDVNADQPPNIWGRDVFGIWLTDRSVLGVYPFGGDYDRQFGGKCSYNANGDTRGCAAQIIKDGWVMKY
ncbi:MAG: type II secretion system GspH family protein [bacterium]|nr:type II secretion system GspH family protein [bacterium]